MDQKRYHHPDLRQKLLDEAVALVREDGIKGFSLRKLAARAGVSHAAPYRHFSGKEEILACILLDGHIRLKAALRDARSKCRGSPADKILALGRAYLEFAALNPERLGVMFSREGLAASAALGGKEPEADASDHDSFGVLEDAVRDAQGAGQLDPKADSGVLAFSIWSEIHGLALLWNEGLIPSMAGQRGVRGEDALEAVMRVFASHCGAI